MYTIEQPVAGATQYDGTAGRGLVTFSDLNLPDNDFTTIAYVTIVALEAPISQSIGIDCFLMYPGETPATTLRRVTILRPQASGASSPQPGFSKGGCMIPVPRRTDASPFATWQLVLITTGKSADCNFVVSYTRGPAPPGLM